MEMANPLDRDQVLQRLEQALPYLKERFGVLHLALYGSFARGTPGKNSDVDLLVRLARPLGLQFVNLVEYLEQLLGRKVGLATFDTLEASMQSPRYRPLALRIQRTLTYVPSKAR
jgi:predicted nucleotidyltransferase